ncbi:MAG: hypothetical protein LWW87_10330 [Geobacteraceae bacterium]|nr:hypothetical protein [Geobacteraceae bacterium]
MGGQGSGSWLRYGQKRNLEQQLRIDIRYLKKNRMLEPGSYTLAWSYGDEETSARASLVVAEQKMVVACNWKDGETGLPQRMDRLIRLSETPCRYGGTRKWFICPQCGNRMAVLVLLPPSIGCRHCRNLSYASQSESISYRALRRRNKIARRLERDEYFGEMLTRPKGMHWQTYYRLCGEHDDADMRSMLGMIAYLEKRNKISP